MPEDVHAALLLHLRKLISDHLDLDENVPAAPDDELYEELADVILEWIDRGQAC